MSILIIGLVLLLGTHSARIFAEPARTALIARGGLAAWRFVYALVSLIGLVLLVWGYSQARLTTGALWTPPVGLRHLAALLVLFAFILLAAAYVPRNAFKARLRHPMVLSVKLWAFAHLLANGSSADVILFGSFLLWAVLSFRAARRRDRTQPSPIVPSTATGTLTTIVLGIAGWALVAFWLHGLIIGVRPLG
jgi:uncharacterized membrane protein